VLKIGVDLTFDLALLLNGNYFVILRLALFGA
jgi:hypothetical protein